MVERSKEILILTRSITLGQGLSALLESLPGIVLVKSMRDMKGAYVWMEDHQPDAVLLDGAFSNDPLPLTLERIRICSSHTQRLVLVDSVEELELLSQYAEGVLLKGMVPSVMAAIMTDLLSKKGDKEQHNS